ncbi:hypothetical protein BGW80DRAFT_1268405 [Lactifluus volemus]|nr:hypothetical protein BGW80DRAFT_1268405 [Lactifluus volemus]
MPKLWVVFSVSNLVQCSSWRAWLWNQMATDQLGSWGFRSGRLSVGSSVMSSIDKGVAIIYAHVRVPLPWKIEKQW